MIKKFYVHGWDYTPQCLTQFIESFADPLGQLSLKHALAWGGGKSFGVAVCMLAGECGFNVVDGFHANPQTIEDLLTSPGEEPIRQWVRDEPFHFIRSSQPEEDWLDGRAGVHKSFSRRSQDVWPAVKERVARGEWLIVQPYVLGIGFVVDVGWSELLERPIVRIAHGNISKTGSGRVFTSATWDYESHVGIYDAETAEAILPLMWPQYAAIARWLARRLVAMLDKLGIRFGVQFELIIHPDRPSEWDLVQLRPSPDAVRGPKSGYALYGEKLLFTTGKVSGAGFVEGDVLRIEDRLREPVDLSGKIAVWDCNPLPRIGVENLQQAAEYGASGQLVERRLFGNSGHGTYGKLGDIWIEQYKQARQKSLLMAHPSHEQYRELVGEVRRGNVTRLLLVSDGLVGQVYKV